MQAFVIMFVTVQTLVHIVMQWLCNFHANASFMQKNVIKCLYINFVSLYKRSNIRANAGSDPHAMVM